jgi:hypothetical protein
MTLLFSLGREGLVYVYDTKGSYLDVEEKDTDKNESLNLR